MFYTQDEASCFTWSEAYCPWTVTNVHVNDDRLVQVKTGWWDMSLMSIQFAWHACTPMGWEHMTGEVMKDWHEDERGAFCLLCSSCGDDSQSSFCYPVNPGNDYEETEYKMFLLQKGGNVIVNVESGCGAWVRYEPCPLQVMHVHEILSSLNKHSGNCTCNNNTTIKSKVPYM